MKKDIEKKIEIPQDVEAKQETNTIIIKGPKGEIQRTFKIPNVEINVKGKEITLKSKKATRIAGKNLFTTIAHIKNMIHGVKNLYTYKLKICNSHFPMNVTINGNKLIIKNFLGEKYPRELILSDKVKAKVNGDQIILESPDIEEAGKTASNIEQRARITGRDRRIFQDGIYIIEKGQR